MNNVKLKTKKYKLGMFFLISVIIFYSFAGITALTPLELKLKGIIVTSLVVIAECCFVLSISFLGKELVKKYKHRFNPINWLKKKE